MTKSPTNKYRVLFYIFTVLSFLLTFGPILYYIGAGYFQADLIREKVSLTCFILCACILLIINLVLKYNIRSVIWLLLIGIYICVDNIIPLLLLVGGGTILDEFIVTPLKKLFKNKYKINKEIDKRI